MPGIAEQDDGFGQALASGDFDHDGYDDLAIGVPFEDWGATVDAGTVVVLHTHAPGVMPGSANQEIPKSAIPDLDSETGDLFGFALAAGDFDATGTSDLAIGVPDEAGPFDNEAGAVWSLHGVLFANAFEAGTTAIWSSVAP